MKKQYSFFVFLFVFVAFAQNNNLLKKIDHYKKQDTIRVELLVDYCVNNTFAVSDKMLNFANEAYTISKRLNYKKGEIRSLNCIGNYYYQQGIYDKAIDNYTKAIRIAEKLKDNENIIIGKSNLASIYIHINESKKALKLFLESDELLVKSGKSESQNRAALLTNIGAAYSSLGLHEESLKYHKKVLDLCNKKNILFGIAISKSNIGDEYVQLKKYEEAFPFLISSMKISEENGFDSFLGQIYKDIGKVYFTKKNYPQSISILKKGIELCTKINDQSNLLQLNSLLHNVYSESENYKKAYTTALDFININDSINSKEKQKIIAETNTKYETEKKEAKINELNQKKKIAELQSNKKTILINSFIISFLALTIIAYFLFSRFKTQKKNELLKTKLAEAEKLLEAEKKATDSELKALKSQMNPHFIFNALNSIQEQFMYGDKLKGNEQLSNFTYLTRQILEVSGKKQITIATEIDILTKYLDLEKMRFAKDFEYFISISPTIDEDYHKIPPMLLQPFVENSVKHGLMHKKGDKIISIHFDLSIGEDYLICTVIDNGIGRKKSAEIKTTNQLKHNSFSTQSIEERLHLLNEKLQLTNLIVYTDVTDNEVILGTKATVNIPLV